MQKSKTFAAIVLAAGKGSRMNSEVHKQYLMLEGKEVLYYSLKALEESFVDEIILVTGKDEISYCQTEIVEKYGFHKVKQVVAGGKERYHSVYEGLCALGETDYVLIQDGARPFLDMEILNRARKELQTYDACVAGMPVKDTIKIIDENGIVTQTPDRNNIWQVQTPQCFKTDLIKKAYQELIQKENEFLEQGVRITDDAMVVELLTNCKVKLFEGSYYNIKITTPEDLDTAKGYLKRSE